MKKALIGLLVLGAIVGLRRAAGRLRHAMREHCGQMAAQCKDMAARFGGRGEAIGGI